MIYKINKDNIVFIFIELSSIINIGDSVIDKFKPDMYQKSIYDLDYKKLNSMGIKCLLFDLDNTIIPNDAIKPSKKIIDLIEMLKKMGFRVIIFSNTSKKRLAPFKDRLEVDCSAKSKKPFKKKFNKVIKEYRYSENEIALIGDQLLTDILGGNRVGIYTILVDRINGKERGFTKINRLVEKILRVRLKKLGFVKGTYYE